MLITGGMDANKVHAVLGIRKVEWERDLLNMQTSFIK